MRRSVTLIPGDGIGQSVTDAACRVLDATGVDLEWDRHLVGAPALERGAESPLPESVLASIREHGLALKGPVATPSGSGFRSVNVALRRELDLFAQVRPCRSRRSTPGLRTADIDVVVVRETTEDLYSGIEYASGEPATRELIAWLTTHGAAVHPDAGISIKPISGSASRRMLDFAFSWARDQGRRRVTIVHKATVMRATDGLFVTTAREVSREHPGIDVDERQVDLTAALLVARPEELDVLVMPNQYGDILSDVAAAMIGGVGLAPGANYGDAVAMFEPAHGTAPRIADRGIANPVATILSGVLLLRHIGEADAADRVERAVDAVLADGERVTYDLRPGRDLSGAATTSEMTDAIIERL